MIFKIVKFGKFLEFYELKVLGNSKIGNFLNFPIAANFWTLLFKLEDF